MPTDGFDHAVLVFSSMAEAEDLAARLGFRTTPRAVHPFGTGNVLAQFDDHNLELLALLDPGKVAADRPGTFSFARFNRDFLERHGPGFSMTVVKMDDQATAAARFRAAGFSPAPFSFARAAKAPHGSDAEVSFDLVFAEHPILEDGQVFACRHKHPAELFYKPAYRSHPNAAVSVKRVVTASAAPDKAAALLAAATGGRREGHAIVFGQDAMEVLSPGEVKTRYGLDVAVPDEGLRHVGLVIASADIDRTRAALAAGGIGAADDGRRLVVSPAAAFGTAFVFEAAA